MKTGVTTLEIISIEQEIEAVREELAAVTAPLEDKLHALYMRLNSAKDAQRGTIYKCESCLAPIYKDGQFWRSVYSEDACCVNKRRHSPEPYRYIQRPQDQRHPDYKRK